MVMSHSDHQEPARLHLWGKKKEEIYVPVGHRIKPNSCMQSFLVLHPCWLLTLSLRKKCLLTHVEVDSGTHSCCTLAIGKYQIYKLISRHSVARYELVDLIFFNS